MKNKHFYHTLVETTDITVELADLDLSPEERIHLLSLIDANIHSTVINITLSNLDEENKKIFLKNLTQENHEKTWEHLKTKSKNLEKQIIDAVEKLKQEFKEDIKNAKSKK